MQAITICFVMNPECGDGSDWIIEMDTSGSWPEILDISLPITPGMPIWPGDPAPTLELVTTLECHGVQVSRLVLSTHTGTHLDAPRHFISGGRTLDQLDLASLVGGCRIIEVANAEGQLARADLQRFDLPPGARVLLKTRNSSRPAGEEFSPDFVALEPSAADYLCEHKVRLVGIDGPSIDAWGRDDFPCHKRLLGADILILENLVLRHITPGIYGLMVAPLNLVGADGCPVRALLTRLPFSQPTPVYP
jgi:arylformamidase